MEHCECGDLCGVFIYQYIIIIFSSHFKLTLQVLIMTPVTSTALLLFFSSLYEQSDSLVSLLIRDLQAQDDHAALVNKNVVDTMNSRLKLFWLHNRLRNKLDVKAL